MLFKTKTPSVGTVVRISEIKDRDLAPFFFKNVQEEIKESLVADGYLSKITFFVFPIILTQMLLVVIVVIVNVTMQGYSYDFPISAPFLVACVLLIPLTFRSSRAYTQLGVDTKQQIKGFKDFLSTTDRDRFDFHNSSFKSVANISPLGLPEKSPTQFMQYLPYAIALGVETKWAKQFQDITIPKPDWYVAGNAQFIASDFVSHMHGTVSDTIAFSSNTIKFRIRWRWVFWWWIRWRWRRKLVEIIKHCNKKREIPLEFPAFCITCIFLGGGYNLIYY
jgi:hypothetical protein